MKYFPSNSYVTIFQWTMVYCEINVTSPCLGTFSTIDVFNFFGLPFWDFFMPRKPQKDMQLMNSSGIQDRIMPSPADESCHGRLGWRHPSIFERFLLNYSSPKVRPIQARCRRYRIQYLGRKSRKKPWLQFVCTQIVTPQKYAVVFLFKKFHVTFMKYSWWTNSWTYMVNRESPTMIWPSQLVTQMLSTSINHMIPNFTKNSQSLIITCFLLSDCCSGNGIIIHQY